MSTYMMKMPRFRNQFTNSILFEREIRRPASFILLREHHLAHTFADL
jgi:hypothetical protein